MELEKILVLEAEIWDYDVFEEAMTLKTNEFIIGFESAIREEEKRLQEIGENIRIREATNQEIRLMFNEKLSKLTSKKESLQELKERTASLESQVQLLEKELNILRSRILS